MILCIFVGFQLSSGLCRMPPYWSLHLGHVLRLASMCTGRLSAAATALALSHYTSSPEITDALLCRRGCSLATSSEEPCPGHNHPQWGFIKNIPARKGYKYRLGTIFLWQTCRGTSFLEQFHSFVLISFPNCAVLKCGCSKMKAHHNESFLNCNAVNINCCPFSYSECLILYMNRYLVRALFSKVEVFLVGK